MFGKKGQAHPLSKLTDKQRFEIRALKKKMRQIEIAQQFGITQGAVSKIMNNNRWSLL